MPVDVDVPMPSTLLSRVPRAFDEPRALRRSVNLAVACALAGITGALLGLFDGGVGLASAVSTTAYALVWTNLARRDSRKPSYFFVGAFPLAALNASTTVLLVGIVSNVRFPELIAIAGAVATIGALLWLPAVILTLACFGLPLLEIGNAERCHGLAAAERAERNVAFVALAMSSISATLACLCHRERPWLGVPIAIALLAGIRAVVLVHLRQRKRRAFIRSVIARGAPGFRVDDSYAVPTLVRDRVAGDAYRAMTTTEAIAELDDDRDVRRVLARAR